MASVGLVAVGASGVQAASWSDFVSEGTKPWTFAVGVRGFYDDNVNSSTSDSKQDSFGVEINPSIKIGLSTEQTTIDLGYAYLFKYYNRLPFGNLDHYDQSHTFDVALNHAFSPRYDVSLRDQFVVGQEPDMLRSGYTFNTFQRIPGDNIRNYGAIDFTAQLTHIFAVTIGYANSLFDYDNHGETVLTTPINGGYEATIIPSLSGTSDSLDHTFHVDGRWQIQPQTVGVIGYQFRQLNYTADELISGTVDVTNAVPTTVIPALKSNIRDWRSHYGYLGADHTFLPDLTGSVRLGARYSESYNQTDKPSQVGPYALASLHYVYGPGRYAELSISHDNNSTDVVSPTSAGDVVQYAESTTVAANVSHQIIPHLVCSVQGQFQNSAFHGGGVDGDNERYYLVGLNFRYDFLQHFAATAGYNYDKLDSQIGRSFDRNRAYIGLEATY